MSNVTSLNSAFQLPKGIEYHEETGEYKDLRSSIRANRFYGESLESIKESHQEVLKEEAKKNETSLFGKPLAFLSNVGRNLFEMVTSAFKTVFFCFFKPGQVDTDQKEPTKK